MKKNVVNKGEWEMRAEYDFSKAQCKKKTEEKFDDATQTRGLI